MTNTVTVVRDSWGIGHITTTSADEAFRAQGWIAASDRMWQMEWDRRRAMGRWAEIAGPGAVAEDRFFRRLDLASIAESDWAGLSADTQAMTEAYAAGVNGWLEANHDRLPAEFDLHPAGPESWQPWHCVLVYKLRHIFMGTLHRKLWRGAVTVKAGPEVARAMVGDPAADSAMVTGDRPGAGPSIDLLADAIASVDRAAADLAAIPDVDGGSNSWALHGTRTASGLPLLGGDPHRGIEFPNVYYQCHLTCDDFDVVGLAFPGVPAFPHFGHNESVAWCITHGMADDTDIFVETDPVAVTRTESIAVHGADPVDVACAATPRGPMVLGDPASGSPVLSMMWTGMSGPDTTFECLRPMLTARSVDELEAAVSEWVLPVNNLLSADVAGNISFKIRGRVVERPPASRWTPVPADAVHAWADLAPVADDRLHRWRNPDRGFLATANNRTADDGPYISLDFAGPSRHDRIVELLEPMTAATVEDMTAIHADTKSLVAPQLIEILASANPETIDGATAKQLLLDWDHELAGESAAATVYSTVRRLWSDEVARRLGIERVEFGEPSWPGQAYTSRGMFEAATTLLRGEGWRLLDGLSETADLDRLLGQLVDDAAADLVERFGPDPSTWRWDSAHIMNAPHPLASARREAADLHPPLDGCPGDGDTVRAASVAPASGERVAGSSVARYVFDLADWDRSGWVVPHGVSGVRGSGHDLDQRSSWLACELLPMAYSADAVAAVAVSTQSLPPAPDVPATDRRAGNGKVS